MRIAYADELKGHVVIDSTGLVLGEVEDALVDIDNWRIEKLRVKLRRDAADTLGQAHTLFRASILEIPTEAVRGVGETVVLDRPAASIAPRDPEQEQAEPERKTGT